MITDNVLAALRDAADTVTTDALDLDRHATDAWAVAVISAQLGKLEHRPEVVVRAVTEGQVVAVTAVATAHRVPLTAWGLGSSVTGQPLPLGGGITLDLSGLVGDPELDETDRIVTAPAGVRGGDLETWLNERGYTLNHFPQSLLRSSIGGWLATRATGQFSSRYGGIENLVCGYRVVLADGTVCDLRQRPRAAMGPDLRSIFLGSEGTLGLITEVSLRVFALPEHRAVGAYAMPDLRAALDVLRELYQQGVRPFLVRLYDQQEASHVLAGSGTDFPPALLLVGSEGVPAVANAEFAHIEARLETAGAASLGADPVHRWLDKRFDFSAVENLLAEPGGYAETIEVANLWSRLGPMYDDLVRELAPLADEVLGHFSHVYDQGASLYVILRGHAADDAEALNRLEQIWACAMRVVIAHDGELSHHHGGGLARRPWVRQSLGSGFTVLERIKAALDPHGVLNPGKLDLGDLAG